MEHDVLVIGASAAGLATAACLKQAGVRATIIEREDVVGARWRRHYDRLHLHTPKGGSALPGLPMPADWPRYPARDQVVAYLESYAAHFELDPIFGQEVTRLARNGEAWTATTTDATWTARTAVVCTGAAHTPRIPSWPGQDGFPGEVLHAADYRNGDPWAGLDVLVVGFGNTACELALDLAERGARPGLSVRGAVNVLPRELLGIPVLSWGIATSKLPPAVTDALTAPLVRAVVGDIRKLGLRKAPYGAAVQIARDGKIPLLDIGTLDLIRSGRCRVHPGIERFDGEEVVFTDGARQRYDAVVLGTGYVPDLGWIDGFERIEGRHELPVQSGRETLPGLYFCGFWWSNAGMLREIGIEARRIAGAITAAA